MTADFYADQYRRYATFCRNYGENRLYKIAGGANSEDFGWTETLMKRVPHRMMNGLSLHYYTTNWNNKGSATQFGEELYFDVLQRCLHIEEAIDKHIAIMDRYDPKKRVALIFDEWGTWYDVEPGTNPGFLFQQNSMRDALVAGMTLNYLNDRCDRVKMANIAQTVNVLQALIFTEDEKLMLTPTYHVYDMYKVHHDAVMLAVELDGPGYSFGEESLPAVSTSASRSEDGMIHLSAVNIDPEQSMEVAVSMEGGEMKSVSATLLSSEEINSHNTFENPDEVLIRELRDVKIKGGQVLFTLPAHSLVMLEIR